jgi:hypothetical protein
MKTHPTMWSLLLLCALCFGADPTATSVVEKPSTSLIAGVQASVALVPDAELIRVRTSRQLIASPSDVALIAKGVRKFITEDAARYRFSNNGILVTRFSYVQTRTDRTVKILMKEAESCPTAYDVATIELLPLAVPQGNRVEAPVKVYTARMDVRMEHFGLQGSMTENIGGFQTLPNGGGAFPANFPIELPNIGGLRIQTGVSVPAGSTLDGDYRLVPSPRDPRQAIRDLAAGALTVNKAAKGTRIVLTTIPLLPSGNAQRNWLNQAIREHCVRTSTPMIDLAVISATGPDGTIAVDTEGPRLHQAWDGRDGGDLLVQRAGTAWYWMQARLNGWGGAEAASISAMDN